MTITVTVSHVPTEIERNAIVGTLTAFNAEHGYPGDPKPIAILLRDDAGEIVGGLWGRTIYDWMFVEFLVVPQAIRDQGLGAKLMATAEAIAIERGCVGSWLTTFTFQARGFYEKLGYEVFGALDNSPRDNVRMFLRKRFG